MPEPCDGDDAVRETLRRFHTEEASFQKTLDLCTPAYREAACEFIHTLAGFGIAHSHVQVDDFAIFQHAALAAAIDGFIAAHPGEALPFERITVCLYARNGTHRADLAGAASAIRKHTDAMRHFSERFNIDIILQVFVEELDADAAIAIAEQVAGGCADSLGFYFLFPEPAPAAASALRESLSRLCAHPTLRDPRIMIGNFPFCLLPPAQFPLAYREALAPLKGHIGAQRDLLRKLAARPPPAAGPCAGCRCRAACHAYTEVEEHPAYAPLLAPRREDSVLFAGGSLAPEDSPADPGLVCTGPAEQGDFAAAVLEGFSTILLVDGYFYTRFPCTTFEVMLALEHGVRVIGSSSIGALRAVELDAHGMEGIGHVYEHLRDRPVKPYHVVAQTYDERNRPLTPPLIELIYLIERAQAEGLLGANQAELCRAAAESFHFTELSFASFFRALPSGLAATLKEYRERKGSAAFDIKRIDAQRLLAHFAATRQAANRPAARERFQQIRARLLRTLFEKFAGSPDLALPDDWRGSSDPGLAGRACPPAETVGRARAFLRDLGVVLADTTRYDQANQFIVSAFFPSFYHLDYYPASATGNGDDFDSAVASACMELIERIPAGALQISERTKRDWTGTAFPADLLPQCYNWGEMPEVRDQIAERHGCVRVTDLIANRPVLVPKSSVMFAYSGTDGNSAGNTLTEAVLYGLYELIERDTAQMHLVDPGLRARLPEFLAAPPDHAACRALIAHAEEKGCRLLLFSLPNVYGLPCVLCHSYDHHRRIQSHGGIAVRADPDAAAYAAAREAYMQYITYFVGTRDDYVAHAPRKQARIAYENARATLFDAPPRPLPAPIPPFPTLAAELDHVISRLTAEDIRHILVADLSPLKEYAVKSVKVIVPGLDLWFCPNYQPSPYLRARARTMNTRLRDGEPVR